MPQNVRIWKPGVFVNFCCIWMCFRCAIKCLKLIIMLQWRILSTEKEHHWPNRPCCHRRHIQTIVTSSHGHEEHAVLFWSPNSITLHGTDDDPDRFTMVNCCDVIANYWSCEVELQNENQRAHYNQENVWLWFYILLMATWFLMSTLPFPGGYAFAV